MNKYLITITCILLLTSCFDIVEEVNFNKDNSGQFKFYLQFKDAQILQQQANNEIAKTINDVRFVNNYDGISNFEYLVDNEKYQFGLKFNFKNIDVLNQAMQYIFKSKNSQFFTYNENKIIRLEHNNLAENIEKNIGQSNAALFDFKQLFAEVKLTTKYTFENKIDSTKNKNASIQNNSVSNTIFLTTKDTLNKQSLADTIFLSK